jgi:cytochrome c peroxidase
MNRTYAVVVAFTAAVLATVAIAAAVPDVRWSKEEVAELSTLWVGSLEALPADPTNRVADDRRAAELGRRLFFDTRLSANGQVASSMAAIGTSTPA